MTLLCWAEAPPYPPQCRDAPWGVSEAGTISPLRKFFAGAPCLRFEVSQGESSMLLQETPHGASLHWGGNGGAMGMGLSP
jgi:hypothetical protein